MFGIVRTFIVDYFCLFPSGVRIIRGRLIYSVDLEWLPDPLHGAETVHRVSPGCSLQYGKQLLQFSIEKHGS